MMQLFRADRADLIARPMSIFTITATGNFRYSEDSCQNLIDCVEAGVAVEIVPVTLMGLIAPVTTVGATVFHTVDVLAGITMAQIIRPGAPVLFGGAPATFHMKIASSPMAAIEALQLDAAYVAVAKALDLPCQSYMALSDSPILDAQAGAETFGSALIAALAGVNSVSGPGMLDFLLVFNLPKLVFDDEMCGQALRFVRDIHPIDDLPVGPLIDQLMADQHLIMAEHTMANWPSELYLPVGDRRPRQPRELDQARVQGHVPAGLRGGRPAAGGVPGARDRSRDRRGAAPDHPVRSREPDRAAVHPAGPRADGGGAGGDGRPRASAQPPARRLTLTRLERLMDERIGRSLFDPTIRLPAFVLRETALAHDIAVLADVLPVARRVVRAARQDDDGAGDLPAPGRGGRVGDHRRDDLAGRGGGRRRHRADPHRQRGRRRRRAGLDRRAARPRRAGAHRLRRLGRRRRADGGPAARDGVGALPVLVEVGVAGARTGVRTDDEAEAVARAIDAADELTLAGVSLYEGVVGGETRRGARGGRSRADGSDATRSSAASRELFDRAGIAEIVVTGGGSTYPDVVAEELARPWDTSLPVRVVLRSGAYVTHDHGLYERVVAVRDAGRAGRAAPPSRRSRSGRRSCRSPSPGSRSPAPAGATCRSTRTCRSSSRSARPRTAPSAPPSRASRSPSSTTSTRSWRCRSGAHVAVGDLVAFGISHPCTAFQLWREALVVDDADRILEVYELGSEPVRRSARRRGPSRPGRWPRRPARCS